MYQRMTARKLLTISLATAALLIAAFTSSAQDRQTDQTPLLPRAQRQQDDAPQGVRDMLIRMQIEKAKKDFQERLDRAERATKLSHLIGASVEKTSKVSNEDRERIDDLE